MINQVQWIEFMYFYIILKGDFYTASEYKQTFTTYDLEKSLTSIEIIDFNYTKYLNAETHIFYPEEKGIIQIENFGLHIHKDGTIIYGCKLESIMNIIENKLPLDYIARVLVDLNADGSKIMNCLCSHYQKKLLDAIYCGDKMNRAKYNLIISSAIYPKKKAEEYIDKEEYENELKEILGEIHYASDLDDDTVFIAGSYGAIVSGENSMDYEPFLINFIQLYVLLSIIIVY